MIPQHYPIEEGKLYGGEYPGHPKPDIAKIRLRHLVTLGIRTFVDLTALADWMAPHETVEASPIVLDPPLLATSGFACV